jgi:uncharacterized protein (DUF1800 family)
MNCKFYVGLFASIALSGCGGGDDSHNSSTTPAAASPTGSTAASPTISPVSPPPVSAADAARLLEQASFGVTASDTARVRSVGIDAYLAQQFAAPMSRFTGYTYTPPVPPANCHPDLVTPTDASSICHRDKYTMFQVQRDFFTHALNNPDQLRQRVSLALSHIFVVSGIATEAYGMAAYQNLLLRDAFGNFRTLIEDVTLSPVMGEYLNMANSDKSNGSLGTAPNENYAREVLQLFSIGARQLNSDGTQTFEANGAAIAAYDQDVIEGFSAVFTGWTFAPLVGAVSNWNNPINFDGVMVPFANHHEPGTKLLLGGVTVPAGQTPAQDLKMALDNIFNHPNVGPFIGKLLIQHLVTSNPTPAYVARISAVFANNGLGVRGDLEAVVRAILTDSEARGDQPVASDFGHLRDPAVFVAGVLRSLAGQSDGVYLGLASASMGEPMFNPQTVFDFYPPTYRIPGTQLLGPQFGIDDAATALARANFVSALVLQGGIKPDPTVVGSTGTSINLSSLAGFPSTAAAVAHFNEILMHGSLSSAASTAMVDAANAQSPNDPLAAVGTALYLILTSGQYQVER